MVDLNDLQKTAAAPQKTATAPQKTASIQKTATAPGAEGAVPPLGGPTPYAPGESVQAGSRSLTVKKVIDNGSEGILYLVTDGRRDYALKRFNPGFKANQAVLSAVKSLPKGYTVELVEYAEDYELMAYYPEGNVAKAGLKGNAEWILAIVLNTAMALDKLHAAGVLHKDVKPANILIKDRQKMSTVLCDFGIADLLDKDGKCATQQLRTPIYAAPEVYTDTVTILDKTYIELTPKADFYSLGMTILSLWMGEGAFMAEQQLAFDKVKGRLAIPADMPDPLSRICRGLLIRNPAKRWAWEEIEKTLNGEEVPVEEDEIIEDLNITYNASKHLIANTPKELSECMADDIDLAKKYLYSGKIEKWLAPYPELVMEMEDIVDVRYPHDQEKGVFAAMFILNPGSTLPFKGTVRETGAHLERDVRTLKDVSNFCNDAFPDKDTVHLLASWYFEEWARVRNKNLRLPVSRSAGDGNDLETACLRVQTIDPLSDITLLNDPSNPYYAMTGPAIGRILNMAYTLMYNDKDSGPGRKVHPYEAYIPHELEMLFFMDFLEPGSCHYITSFFDTKGDRFVNQKQWFLYCTDRTSADFQNKCQPKDDNFYDAQVSCMKTIKGFGCTPFYDFVKSGDSVTTLSQVFSHSSKQLREEYKKGGLQGFLAVHHHEDPDADLSAPFAYEKRLKDYLEDLRRIDDTLQPVQRFDEARKEADRILSDGKGRIRGLAARSVLQYVGTIALAVIPALILLTMLVFSIIENPILDTSGLRLSNFVWTLGFLLGIVVFFTSDTEDVGCLSSLIAGGILAAIIWVIVKFLGGFVLYLFAAIVLAVLIYFSIKTLFSPSPYARMARKFTKPGFDEKVLEPLYYAFSNDTSFDSSLNGAFDDDQIANWKDDLKRRRLFVLVFIGAVWVLFAFSLLVPKSERFGRLSRPLFQKQEQLEQPEAPSLLQVERLEPGTRSEDVKTMQQFLKEAGYFVGTPSPTYGPATKKAVKAFQKANGLPETGIADTQTINSMNQKAYELQQMRKE